MSRRSQWESMRQEARSRVDDIESKLFLDTTLKSDSWLSAANGSIGRDGVNVCGAEQVKGQNTATSLRKEHVGKSSQTFEKSAISEQEKDNCNNEKHDNKMFMSLNNEKGGLMFGVVDVPTAASPLRAGSADVSAMSTTVLNITGDSFLDDTLINPKNTGVYCEGLANDYLLSGGGGSLRGLQLELAQEKRKNIAAEQRIVALDKELKAVRSEKTNLACSENGRVKTSSQKFIAGNLLKNEVGVLNGVNKTHMEQIILELQKELSLLKEYTKELEARLAEKSSALESCICEVNYKEQRIRQLERTIADELIRRCKSEENEQNEKKSTTKSHFGSSGVQNVFVNKSGERDNIIRNTVVPSVIHCSSTYLRSQLDKEQQQQQQQREQRGVVNNDDRPKTVETNNLSSKELSSVSNLREKSQQRSSLLLRQETKSDKQTEMKEGGKRGGEQKTRSGNVKNVVHQSTELSATFSTGRASCITSARQTARSTRSSVNLRRVSTPATASQKSSRPSSTTRKVAPTKFPHKRHSNLIAKSISPPPLCDISRDISVEDPSVLRSPSSRRRINRPPPIESSLASISCATTGTGTSAGMMHHMEARSSAQPPRSRPLIYHDGKGLTTVKTLGTTIVTRSAKRRDSPVPESSQRPDSVERVLSDSLFLSERVLTTKNIPDRLVQLYRGGSSSRSPSQT